LKSWSYFCKQKRMVPKMENGWWNNIKIICALIVIKSIRVDNLAFIEQLLMY
jgi:hypothetical protein